MTTSQYQEMTSHQIANRRGSLTIPNRQIKEDSQTCLKTLLKKTQEIFYEKKAMLGSDLGYILL
jgi:hypothetical protein